MEWVRDRINDALDAFRAEMQGQLLQIVPAEETGALRGEVAMLRAELESYRTSGALAPAIIEAPPESADAEAMASAAVDVAEAAATIVASAEAVAEMEAEEILENEADEENDDFVDTNPGGDTSVPRQPWYERPLFGGKKS